VSGGLLTAGAWRQQGATFALAAFGVGVALGCVLYWRARRARRGASSLRMRQ
jgi:hypothetical protein